MKKKDLIKIIFCGLSLISVLGCNSNSKPPGEKIKSVLDNFDRIIKNHDSEMRKLAKSAPRRPTVQESLEAKQKMCDDFIKIDASGTPPDFQSAFKNLVSNECKEDPQSLEAITTNEKEAAVTRNLIMELQKVSEKYGYIYKDPLKN